MKDFYYPHEQYFFYCIAAVAFAMAWAAQGIYFIAALILGSWLWCFIFLIWSIWRYWYVERENKKRKT